MRCRKCGHKWQVAGEAITPDALELADLEAEEKLIGNEIEFVDAPAPVGAVENAASASTARSFTGSPPGTNAATLLRERRYQDMRGARLRQISRVWMVTVGLLVFGLGALVVFRQALVERSPGFASVFGAFGIKVTPSGFDMSPVEMRRVRIDGTEYLVVSGEVRNLTNVDRPAPTIAMRLLGTEGIELARWSVDVGDEVPAKGTRTWESEYPNPPVDGLELAYTFE